MRKNNHTGIRLICYFIGLFVMTLGISMSVKTNLGTSPVSSIPYTITCIFGMEMGKATILFHAFLVLLQILILRRSFKIKNLLQVIVGIVFGYFTTFSNFLFSFLPTPENILIRLLMTLCSIVMIAIGIFFYLPADIMPMAAEGLIKTLSDILPVSVSNMKILFDITVVSVSLISCLLVLRTPGSVGIGTALAALLVGAVLGRLNKHFGTKRDLLLGISQA